MSTPSTKENTHMYEMRLLKAYTTKTNLQAECWCVHHANDPGNSVLQVDLFVAKGRWHAWDSCYITRQNKDLARSAAETRNALAGLAVSS